MPLVTVADGHIWGAARAFAELPGYDVDLRVVAHDEMTPARVRDADVLLVRSSTRVDAALLGDSRVRFVATATVGDDHIDRGFLQQRGIAFASAAGSSTGSVVEYVIACLFHLWNRHGMALPGCRLGVVGVGRIGSAVAARASALGMEVLANDPPRQQRGDDAFDWQPLERLLEQADILTLHTPLLRDGAHATRHLLDAAALERFRGRVVINAARGAVVDNGALLRWLEGDDTRLALLDCWEGEPNIDRGLLVHSRVVVATPHIAGHSLDGKAANTQFVYDALCRFLGVERTWRMEDDLPEATSHTWPEALDPPHAQVAAMIETLYPLSRDVADCRGLLRHDDVEAFAAAFTRLRRGYPVRRSWSRHRMRLTRPQPELAALATAAGLNLVT